MTHLRALLAAIASALLISGCAVLGPGSDDVPRAEAFDVIGRVLASGGGRGFSSSLRWNHRRDGDELWLMSPVGQTLAHIAANASGASLTAADGQIYQAMTAEGLTERALGWAMPLTRLQYWVRGSIFPGGVIGLVSRDGDGRLVQLMQDGWTINYIYENKNDGTQLPKRLDIARGDQRLRFVIDNWRNEDMQ